MFYLIKYLDYSITKIIDFVNIYRDQMLWPINTKYHDSSVGPEKTQNMKNYTIVFLHFRFFWSYSSCGKAEEWNRNETLNRGGCTVCQNHGNTWMLPWTKQRSCLCFSKQAEAFCLFRMISCMFSWPSYFFTLLVWIFLCLFVNRDLKDLLKLQSCPAAFRPNRIKNFNRRGWKLKCVSKVWKCLLIKHWQKRQ